MESQCLVGNDRNAANLLISKIEKLPSLLTRRMASQVDQVHDRFKRIIDFMRD